MEIRRSPQRFAFPAGLLLLLSGVLLLLALPAGVAHGQEPQPPVTPGEGLQYDEAEAHAIDRQLMCPVCPAQTIDQAQVALARQMRQIVREMLAEGATRQEILDFFADRYGPDVLAAPSKSGFNLVAWVLPPVGLAAALVAGVLVLRAMAARRSGEAADGLQDRPPDDDLAPYLEMVDRQLDLDEDPALRPSGEPPRGRYGAGGGVADAADATTHEEDGRHDG